MAGPRRSLVSMVSKLLANPGRWNGRAGREPPGLACHASMEPVPSGVWSRFVHPSAPPALNTFLYQGGMERMIIFTPPAPVPGKILKSHCVSDPPRNFKKIKVASPGWGGGPGPPAQLVPDRPPAFTGNAKLRLHRVRTRFSFTAAPCETHGWYRRGLGLIPASWARCPPGRTGAFESRIIGKIRHPTRSLTDMVRQGGSATNEMRFPGYRHGVPMSPPDATFTEVLERAGMDMITSKKTRDQNVDRAFFLMLPFPGRSSLDHR